MKATFKSTKTIVRAKPASTSSSHQTGDSKANRETYLENAIGIIGELFTRNASVTVPAVRVSCGFPVGQRGSKKFTGQTWDRSAAKDGKAQIFITPLLDDTVTVLGVLCHELIHATLGNDEGHGSQFRHVAHAIGLGGRMKDTHPTSTLEEWLKANVVALLGEYPHAKLSLDDREKGTGTAKQTTRYFKCWCPKSGYVCRASRQWIDQYGPPVSPATKKPMESDYIPDASASKGGAA